MTLRLPKQREAVARAIVPSIVHVLRNFAPFAGSFASLVLAAGIAQGANASPACPTAAETNQSHLLGLWRAQFQGLAKGATLLLEKHPELAKSVRGAIDRDGERAQVAGDVDEGEFTLEESVNGTSLSAAWLCDVVEGSCGREIRGTWQAEGAQRAIGFVLRKR